MKDVTEHVQKSALNKCVPHAFLQATFSDETQFRDLVYTAGAMEAEGATFTEQQAALGDLLVKLWKRQPQDVKDAMLNPARP